MVIDTEGLISLIARDLAFDNLIATFALAISHIVIINSKGELSRSIQELLEICVYAIKYLELGKHAPKIFFALRDCADSNPI